MADIPNSRSTWLRKIEELIKEHVNDPVVEVQHIDPGNLRLRVSQDRGRLPRYFRIRVSEEK